MARLDLYRVSGMTGYALDVQADLMSMFATTVVVPLLPLDSAPRSMTRLNPIFEIGGNRYVMVTQSIAAVSKKELGASVGSLDPGTHYEVTNALDLLLSGDHTASSNSTNTPLASSPATRMFPALSRLNATPLAFSRVAARPVSVVATLSATTAGTCAISSISASG